MGKAEDSEILTTNLQPFFWRKVKNIIRQNKKGALLEFLFGSDNGRGDSSQSSSPALDAKIQNLQNQVNSLQNRISDLETTLENSKYALSGTLDAPDGTKIIQQGDWKEKRGLLCLKMRVKLIWKFKNQGVKSQKLSQRPK